jgi:hypothetical protein
VSYAASERLRLYARYAALTAEQESALEADDLQRFAELATERDVVRGEVERLGAPDPSAEGSRILEPALDAERRIQRRLADLRNRTAAEIRELDRRDGGTRGYVRTLESDARPRANIDVRY